MSDHIIERAAISIFNPNRTDPKHLEAIFTQREPLLKDAVERIEESARTGNKHQLLFVGPRGSGKSHFITLLVYRLGRIEGLEEQLQIAWLNEDETATSLLDFLIQIYEALCRRHPSDYQKEEIEELYDGREPAEAQRFLRNLLIQKLDQRTLLIVTENLDALMKDIGDKGQKELRAFIQENPLFCFAATAQSLSPDLTDRVRPFYGFFQTEHLRSLNVEEASELLQKIAALNKQGDLVRFLTTPTGKARIEALHRLSGGNHRIYLILSQFITRDSIDALVAPFMAMVDKLTPYYQERLRWLPTLQRKIIEFLCTAERPMTVKKIAGRLFKTHPSVSKQLQELREKSYVLDHARGREVLYEIAEPLMRLCVEVKENQTTEPLRLLVNFLRVWYDKRDLHEKLAGVKAGGSACQYLQKAIELNQQEGNLRAQLICDEIRSKLPDFPESEDLGDAGNMALLAIKNKEFTQAIRLLNELISDSKPQIKKLFPLYFLRAYAYQELGDPDKGIKDYTSVISLKGAPPELVAKALFNRGVAYGQLGETDKEIKGYTAAISLKGAPPEQVAKALFNRGVAYGQLGETDKEIKNYTAAICLKGAPPEQVAKALFNRGFTYGQLGETDKEIKDYTAAISLKGVPPEQVAMALFNRGFTYFFQSHFQKSKRDFQNVIGMDELETERIVDAYLMLTEISLHEGSWKESLSHLAKGLSTGSKEKSPYYGSSTDHVAYIFTSILDTKQRHEKINDFSQVYKEHKAWPNLGESLIEHLGSLYQSDDELPASDNLEQWLAAWLGAGKEIPDAAIPLRILETGIAFLKTKGKNKGILLDLKQEERAILEQALGLKED